MFSISLFLGIQSNPTATHSPQYLHMFEYAQVKGENFKKYDSTHLAYKS